MANVCGFKCGCGREWHQDYHLHDMVDCSWNKCTGDIICSEYSHDMNHQLNTIRPIVTWQYKRRAGAFHPRAYLSMETSRTDTVSTLGTP